MSLERIKFKILSQWKVWDDDSNGLAEYSLTPVLFGFRNEHLPYGTDNPEETIDIIEQHKKDVKDIDLLKDTTESKEYYKKYLQDPWIGSTENYDISYDFNYINDGYYSVREKFYYIYKIPIEIKTKIQDHHNGRILLTSRPRQGSTLTPKESQELYNLQNYEFIEKYRPSQLDIIKN